MRQIVSPPAFRKARNGLLEVANRIDVGDERFEDGVTFTPRGCQAIFAHVPFCPSEDKSLFAECTPAFAATAYLLEIGLAWSLVDLGADPKEILTDAIDQGSSSVLERLAWEGVGDVAPGTPIAQPTAMVGTAIVGVKGRVMAGATIPPTLAGTALTLGAAITSIPKAIGTLEDKLVDAQDHIGGGGTLFMAPSLAAQADLALERDGKQLITRATGSAVVVGNFPPGKIIAVNGEVDVYLGESIFLETTERSKNEWIGRAERRAITVWNPCGVFAVTIG